MAKNKTYVAGDNKDAAILLIHDVYGWKFPNLRLLADHYAKEANATVFLPDFFDGGAPDPAILDDPEKRKQLDIGKLLAANSKEIRGPEIHACAEQLKSQYKKIGAIGFCYGGWGVFQLAAKGKNLLDCVITAHPSLLEKKEIEDLAVPTMILAPENDPQLTPELKEFCNQTIPKLNIQYSYEYFPGLSHGFAVKGDPNDEAAKKGLERAKNAAVYWFHEHLHAHK